MREQRATRAQTQRCKDGRINRTKDEADLGLTGVTVNAMALIAPGAFLWITFVIQAGYAYPSGMAMWAGIFVALVLAYATALSYSELAKLYPGAGSSYLFAEQAFLNTTHAYRFSRIAKFVIGWASHLYYWVYPGVMVATMGVMIGIHRRQFGPERDERGRSRARCSWRWSRSSSPTRRVHRISRRERIDQVNIAINAIQIVALLFFSALAIAYRLGHPEGSTGLALDGTKQGAALRVQRRAAGASKRALGHPAAQLQLDDAAGDDRDSAAGRIRIGHVDGRGSQESQEGHSRAACLLSLTIQGLFCT